MQTLYLSDDDDAIILKRFERGSITKEILDEVKEGDFVEAYGQVINDSFLSDLVFMPNQIEKIEEVKRLDLEKEKRVELHIHLTFPKWMAFVIFRSLSKRQTHGMGCRCMYRSSGRAGIS